MKWSWLKILLPGLLILPVVVSGLFSSKDLIVTTDFTKRTPWFDYLLPIGRTERLVGSFKLISEPVYFDLRLPVRTDKVKMTLRFKERPPTGLRLGLRQSEAWDYFFPEQLTVNFDRVIEATTFSYTPDNRLRFIISCPGVSEADLYLVSAQALIERYDFSWSWLSWSLVNRYRQWVGDILAPLIRATQPH